MAYGEGVRRIVRVLSAGAWICAISAVIFSVVVVFGRSPEVSIFALLTGAAAFAVLQGAAWIIAGFSGNPAEADGLIRWGWFGFRRKTNDHRAAPSLGPAGVGGWLWLPILGLIALGPLTGIGQTFKAIEEAQLLYPQLIFMPAWSNYKTVGWTLVSGACVVSVFAGYRLLRDLRPQTVAFAILALWIRGPLVSVLDAVAANVLLDITAFEYFGDPRTLGAFLGAVATALFWTLYFKWSRRVRNTYFNHLVPPRPAQTTGRSEPTL